VALARDKYDLNILIFNGFSIFEDLIELMPFSYSILPGERK
jgi:hypothetical protein